MALLRGIEDLDAARAGCHVVTALRTSALATALLALTLAAACGSRSPAADAAPPARARRIDVHTHFGPAAAPRMIALMDARGIDTVWNLSGGSPGRGLEQQLAAAGAYPGRIVVFATLDFREPRRGPGWGARLAASLRAAHALGARGLKIPKGLGLGYTDELGALIPVDSAELDEVFTTAGTLGMPVAIHTGDPVAFFSPATPENERWDELSAHPEWSFHRAGVPSWEELFAALERRVARHPKTTFISVHFGNAPEYPDRVGALLDRYPNLTIDTAARIPEVGRHDATRMRAFYERFADRVLFGTDLGVGVGPGELMLGSTGPEPPTEADVERFFSATWRYFETTDRGFPHPTPIQGRWTIDGVGLSRELLRKIYGDNATRLLH
ncbi:MAG: amidohydrolase [Myxococcales bacterium]|nr:amidohydrolase [Myxococcales bacterium]